MFKVNDYVVYGSTGVCQIKSISLENFGGRMEREYYVLNSVNANSMDIYIPTDKCNVVMRKIMSKEEIYELIKVMPDIESEWISDDHFRKTAFREIIQTGDQKRMVQLIKTIYARKNELEKNGKKLTNSDAETMKTAEKFLYNEFAHVLDIQPEQVDLFIMGRVQI